MIRIIRVMFSLLLGDEAVEGFKERAKEEGYTKIDYVAIFFLMFSFLLVFLKNLGLLLSAVKELSTFN